MTTPREHWRTKIGFILTAAGSAIGLGTLWRLPYAIGENGGGAFILIFIGFLMLVGLPFFILELSFGRHAQSGLITAFDKASNNDGHWSAFAWVGIACSLLIAGWYSVIAGWSLQYILLSLTDAFAGKSTQNVANTFDDFRASGSLNILWQLSFLALTSIIVGKGVIKGIEKFSTIFTSALFIAIFILFCYSINLDGFGQALNYILLPNWEAVTGSTFIKAMGLALFALSLGEGIMVTYGSYMSEKEDIPKTAGLVTASIVFISVLVSLMIFPMVFTFGFSPNEGEGLIFKILPYVFGQIPGGLIVSLIFFTLLLFAAITSSVAQFEVVVASLKDKFNWKRKHATQLTAAIAILIGLPAATSMSNQAIFSTWPKIFKQSYLETCYMMTDWMLIIFTLGITLLWMYKTPKRVVKQAFCNGSKYSGSFEIYYFLCRYVVPLAVVLVCIKS